MLEIFGGTKCRKMANAIIMSSSKKKKKIDNQIKGTSVCFRYALTRVINGRRQEKATYTPNTRRNTRNSSNMLASEHTRYQIVGLVVFTRANKYSIAHYNIEIHFHSLYSALESVSNQATTTILLHRF